MYQLGDTICAIATGSAGARGIVRISGSAAISLVARAFDPAEELSATASARIIAGHFVLGPTARLPCQLYVWPTVRSYTREPLIEVHTLGSLPLLEALIRDLCQAGARLAQPGEFTLRAFLAGRIDLTQAEAVLGVIHAQQQTELRVALDQLAGGIARPMTATRDDLLDLLAELEAGLDFVEEDIQFIHPDDVRRRIESARQAVRELLEQTASRGDTTQLARIVLLGCPNTGKSSLFNLLADDTRALVADVAGTTRDYVTGRMTIADQHYQLVDTAGLFETAPAQQLDHLAQSSARAQHATATLQLLCIDSSRPLNDWERQQLAAPQPAQLVVLTKTDHPPAVIDAALPATVIRTSSAHGQGIEPLRQAIAHKIAELRPPDAALVAGTAQRCRAHLQQAFDSLSRAAELSATAGHEELIAAEIRVVLNELGQVVGAVYTDDLLDRIFSRFCIGK